MKNQKIFLIILALLVVVAGVWFVSRDKEDPVDEVAIENDNEEEIVDDNVENQDETSEDNSQDQVEAEEDTSNDEQAEEVEADIKAGSPAPDFTVENLQGETVSLSDYKGKIVLLNFWATWCGFCVQEMPDLNKLNNEFEDVAVLAVDVMEEKSIVSEYIEEGGYDFDVVLDLEGEVARTYLVSAYPTTYFIEEDGTLIGRVAGMLEYDTMVEIIESIKSDR